eukprot:jgi/Phyca11/8983/fgenesh1_pm.PHYCAscaffold_33_\
MTPPKKRLKRIVPFLEAHEKMYGVRVVERDVVSQEVQSVLCMFCAAFGREADPNGSSRRRARTTKPKYWGGPTFRTDNYTSHLTMQHPLRWREYQELSSEQKLSYFNAVQALPKANGGKRKSQSNEQATSEQNSVSHRDVVDVVLSDVFFRAEDADDGAGDELVVFESTLDEWDTEDQHKSDGTAEVRVVVRSAELFRRVVELLAVGLSFDQTAAICQAQTITGIRGSNFVPNLARVVVCANLQALSRVLERCWTFSLSLHSVDRRHKGEKAPRVFIDVRVRAYCSGKMEIFHLCEQQALPGFVYVSSARPALDELMQWFFDSVLFSDGAKWYSNLTRLSAYLQRQIATGNAQELSAASVAVCPHVSDMTWWKVTEIARWFDNARVPIQQLLARRKASVAPSPAWWLDLKTVLVVGSMAMKTRNGLQAGYSTLLSQQPQRISMLRLALAGEVGVEGPLPAFQRAALRDQNRSGQMIGSQDVMPNLLLSSLNIMNYELQHRVKLLCNSSSL